MPRQLHRFLGLRPSEVYADKSESRRASTIHLSYLAVLYGLSLAGFAEEVWLLWFLPARLGGFILMVGFQWLPHHPHVETGRYLNTRLFGWPGASIVLLMQNYHLIHHLHPSIPFYRYAAVYQKLIPVLKERGVAVR